MSGAPEEVPRSSAPAAPPVGNAASNYSFRLDDAEIARFRSMASNAHRHEHELWTRAGIRPGATVVDLGCGPGALLPLLSERVGWSGTIIGIDADPSACAIARRVAASIDAPARIVCADGANTQLPATIADTVMCRNVLVHNGPRAAELLNHAATLLRRNGRLLSAEPDVAGIDFGAAHAEREYEHRWAAMTRADGNDPCLGHEDRLPQLLRQHGWQVLAAVSWTDHLEIDKSPAWAAAETIVDRGFATAHEVAHWRRALAQRQATGPLRCSLLMTTVLAAPPT